jgi:hypothetical protein
MVWCVHVTFMNTQRLRYLFLITKLRLIVYMSLPVTNVPSPLSDCIAAMILCSAYLLIVEFKKLFFKYAF